MASSSTERQELGAARRFERRGRAERGDGPAVLLFYARWVPKKGPDRLAAALRWLDRAATTRCTSTGVAIADAIGGHVQRRPGRGRHRGMAAGWAEGRGTCSRRCADRPLASGGASGRARRGSSRGHAGDRIRRRRSRRGTGRLPARACCWILPMRRALRRAVGRAARWRLAGGADPAPFPSVLEAETSVERLVGFTAGGRRR